MLIVSATAGFQTAFELLNTLAEQAAAALLRKIGLYMQPKLRRRSRIEPQAAEVAILRLLPLVCDGSGENDAAQLRGLDTIPFAGLIR